MNKTLLSLLYILIFVMSSHAQDFTEDFESYNSGDFLVASSNAWSTWSGSGAGTAEDIQIGQENALSGTNSIKFVGTSGGGPTDIVLPFGEKYTTGFFKFSSAFLIEENSNAYFSLQGEEATGQTWSLNGFFRDTGLLSLTGGDGSIYATTPYLRGQWFVLEMEINLTDNIWKILIDGTCITTFQNGNNFLASFNLYPENQNSVFFVDDVTYSYLPDVPEITDDIALVSASIDGQLAGNTTDIMATILNNGENIIESFDATFSDGTISNTNTFSGLNIGSGESYDFVFEDSYTFDESITNLNISVTNLNGDPNLDQDKCNDTENISLNVVTPAEGKKVIIESGTGTWCSECPRGEVFLEAMEKKYPDHFIGIAVHNSQTGMPDPMSVQEYDEGLGIISFPNTRTMRSSEQDPAELETSILDGLQTPALATFEIGANFNESTREIDISVITTFLREVFGVGYDISLIVKENKVTGDDDSYNQSNFYAGGNNGIMGGYENLPDPVPFDMIEYNSVARAILGGFDGIPLDADGVQAGDTRHSYFSYTVPESFNMQNIELVALLINPGGTINNGESITTKEAIENGFMLSNTQDLLLTEQTHIFPNPVKDQMNVELSLEKSSEVEIQIIDAMGKMVANRKYGKLAGRLILPYNTGGFNNGIYYLRLYVDGRFTTKKIIVAN